MERREVSLLFPPCKAVPVPRPVAKDSSGIHAVSMHWALVLFKLKYLQAACILQVPHSYWLKWQNHNSFVLCLTRLQRQKKNQPRSTRDSRSAGRGPASIRPCDSAGRCLSLLLLLRNRAADRGPIQMYGAGTFSVAEIAGHALTDLRIKNSRARFLVNRLYLLRKQNEVSGKDRFQL